MSQIVIKDLLKKDFGFDLDIAGGLGQSALKHRANYALNRPGWCQTGLSN